ncbi:hypothetical protein HYR82_02900 [Candidatus Peregrinibacteria bacterium]|nr:hypothetical protein [Candidatus Peregrinibacteria bacterium]
MPTPEAQRRLENPESRREMVPTDETDRHLGEIQRQIGALTPYTNPNDGKKYFRDPAGNTYHVHEGNIYLFRAGGQKWEFFRAGRGQPEQSSAVQEEPAMDIPPGRRIQWETMTDGKGVEATVSGTIYAVRDSGTYLEWMGDRWRVCPEDRLPTAYSYRYQFHQKRAEILRVNPAAMPHAQAEQPANGERPTQSLEWKPSADGSYAMAGMIIDGKQEWYVVTKQGTYHRHLGNNVWKHDLREADLPQQYLEAFRQKRTELSGERPNTPPDQSNRSQENANQGQQQPAEGAQSNLGSGLEEFERLPTAAKKIEAILARVNAGSPEAVSFSLNGRRLEYTGRIEANYFRKRSILRLDDYRRNVETAALRMQSALNVRAQWNVTSVNFDEGWFTATDPQRGLLKVNALYALEQPVEWRSQYENTYKVTDARGNVDHLATQDFRDPAVTSTYQVFRHDKGTSGYVDKIRTDGGLQSREFLHAQENRRHWQPDEYTQNGERTQNSRDGRWVNDGGSWGTVGIRYYDGRNPEDAVESEPRQMQRARHRPTIIKVLADSAEVILPARDGSRENDPPVTLARGLYYVPESGPPIRNFQKQHATLEEDAEGVRAWAEDVASRLGTPEAIVSYLTANFDWDYREQRNPLGAVGWQNKENWSDVKHPLQTLRDGTGHCTDFAMCIQYLWRCLRPPIESIVTKNYSIHFRAAYLEERTDSDGSKRYNLCMGDNGGFRRLKENPLNQNHEEFTSAAQAMRFCWDETHDQQETAVHWQVKALMEKYTGGVVDKATLMNMKDAATGDRRKILEWIEDLVALRDRGGGLITVKPPENIGGHVGVDEASAFTEDWSSITRKI